MPQLSSATSVPQPAPRRAHICASLSGVQTPQTFGTPPAPQRSMGSQVPHSTVRERPQLSSAASVPQSRARRAHSSASLSAEQPHACSVPPPPQVSGAVQDPHDSLRAAPQLSVASTVPQLAPRRAQKASLVSATQASLPEPPLSTTPASIPPSSGAAGPPPHAARPIPIRATSARILHLRAISCARVRAGVNASSWGQLLGTARAFRTSGASFWGTVRTFRTSGRPPLTEGRAGGSKSSSRPHCDRPATRVAPASRSLRRRPAGAS